MVSKKKAIAIVAGPYRMMQAIWFTLMYPEYSWSIVLLRYGEDTNNLADMEKACELSERFEKIYKVITPTRFSNKLEMVSTFIKMIVYYLIGKKKRYCKNLIESYIGEFNYDLMCLACSYSVFEGAALNFSDEISTIMMQEGLSDYIKVETNYGILMSFVGKLLFKMGYTNFLPLRGFSFNKYCIKYATEPELLTDNSYLEVRKLFNMDLVNAKDFEAILEKMYKIEKLNYDLILFSSITQSIHDNADMNTLRKWLNKHYGNKKILIKKHPQDIYKYEWNELDITCKYNNVPGEILIKLAKDIELIFAFPSTLLLSVIYEQGYNYHIIRYSSGMNSNYYSNCDNIIQALQIKGDVFIEL